MVPITGAERGPHRRGGRAAAALAIHLFAATVAGAVTDRSPRSASGGGMARARFLMGTRLSIETGVPAPAQALEAAFAEVGRLEVILSNWTTTSEISRLNEAAARAPVRCSRELFGALSAALDWAETTDGAFDPTVEPLTRALRLRDDGPARAPAVAPAAHDERREDLPIGWRHVRLIPTSRSVRFDAPGVGIDLGGIGKGIALDAAARTLRSRGVRSALLDFGGQVLAIGRPPDERAWTVGIADPHERDSAVAEIEIADLSVATSGNAERSVMGPDGPIGHILDPRTRRPAAFGGSVTVAARDATSADALSTALFVMGPHRGVVWADAREIAAVYLWRDTDGVLRRRPTRAFARRFGEGDDAGGD